MVNKICYIIGASNENIPFKKSFVKDGDIVIAADGGLKFLNSANIEPDVCLGDFDSLGYAPKNENTIIFKAEKDETDTFLAYLEGKKRNFSSFVIFGGLGGDRLDHTIANLQTLQYIAKRGDRALLVGENTIITAISNDKIKIPKKKIGYVSIFCLGENAQNVSIKGLKYETENISLNSEFPLGISNEFIDKNAEIEVKNGTLIILFTDNCDNFIDYI